MTTKLSNNTIARLHHLEKFSAKSILIFIVQLAGATIFSFLIVKAEGYDSIQNTFMTIELKKLSLEYLMGNVVTSVSLHPKKISASPSAIQVVADLDIQRSGASNISEALRLADSWATIKEPPQENVKKMK